MTVEESIAASGGDGGGGAGSSGARSNALRGWRTGDATAGATKGTAAGGSRGACCCHCCCSRRRCAVVPRWPATLFLEAMVAGVTGTPLIPIDSNENVQEVSGQG